MWMGLVTLTNYLHLRPKISRQLWVSGPTPTTVLENTKYWFFGLDFIDIEIWVKFRYCECVNTNFKGCYDETCFKHHIVYIVGCKRLVRMTWDICNDQKYIFKNLQHSLKKGCILWPLLPKDLKTGPFWFSILITWYCQI